MLNELYIIEVIKIYVESRLIFFPVPGMSSGLGKIWVASPKFYTSLFINIKTPFLLLRYLIYILTEIKYPS